MAPWLCSVPAAAAPAASDGQLDVVATTTQIGDWVREVGGDAVAVDQILQPNTDPHEYEPRPSDVAAAASAKLVFASGDDLDGWIDQIVSDSGSDAKVVDLGAGGAGAAAGREQRRGGLAVRPALVARPAQRRGGGARDRAAGWPPPTPRTGAGSSATPTPISRALRRARRAASPRCIDAVPAAERKLVTDHDAFGYFAHRYGIDVVGAVIPSQTTQAQPSAKDLSELVDLIEREGVEAVFPESSLSAKVAEAIARQTGASADYTLYGDTLGPAGSSGATYLGMEAANADAMVRGFSGREARVPARAPDRGRRAGGRLRRRPPRSPSVSFALAAGERLALLGPNGGGKTTLLRALLGELRPLRGHAARSAPRCGSVPQTERSRLDYPVSALDVATMGALSRLPWWRRPGRAEREAARGALAPGRPRAARRGRPSASSPAASASGC